MIGVSLPFKWFTDGTDTEGILALLKDQGVGSVELRTVKPDHTPESVLHAAEYLWENGFQITVHGSVKSAETAVSDVFAPLAQLLPKLQQEKLNVTVHPIVGDNCAMVTALSDHILEKNYPVTIALENNRRMPDKTEGDSAALVLEVVTKADRENVGICFDMGHYAYYVKKNCPLTPDLLPGKEFWKRVIHTHIHGLNELRTHFPLGVYELPLKEYLDKLSFGYFGVYNLELDFPRIAPVWTPETALEQSLPVLRDSLHYCAKLYDTVRENFDGWFASALKCWETEEEGTTFSLIHSSSYLFQTNGIKWGMDIAFRNARFLAKSPAEAARLLQDMDFMVLSHGHRDHFEESTICCLAENKTVFVVPDFLKERILDLGVDPKKVITAIPGGTISLFGVDILPFESSHFRPDGKGVHEYGYYITAPGCPSMAFPVDIRDFSKKEALPMADYCFANVWLKDNSADRDAWEPVTMPWADYMLRFSDKNIFLTHLFEDGRPDNRMWRSEHAEAASQAIRILSPQTNIYIPQRGECIKLK